MDETNFLTWIGRCLVCKTKLTDGRGIFCANFCTSKEHFPPCRVAYCGECYRAYEDDPFPVQRTVDDEKEGEERGFEVDDESRGRFMHGRMGDHVHGVGFECDVCNFRNINKRDVVWGSSRDKNTLRYIRRASLDVMWSREPDTPRDNYKRMLLDWGNATKVLAIGNIFPRLGNPRMEDRVGMGIALIMLNVSTGADL